MNQTLIYLKVNEESDLYQWLSKVNRVKANYAPFYEPDMNNEMTAMAVLSNPEVDELLYKMKLV
jgi:hypothetical protein